MSDLTVLVVGDDALSNEVAAALIAAGPDVERCAPAQAQSTIEVAAPDLVVLGPQASADGGKALSEQLEARLRDSTADETAALHQLKMLVLCSPAVASKAQTFRHDWVGTLDPKLGASEIGKTSIRLLGMIDRTDEPLQARSMRIMIASARRKTRSTMVGMPAAEAAPQAAIAPPKRRADRRPAGKPQVSQSPAPAPTTKAPARSAGRVSMPSQGEATPLSALLGGPGAVARHMPPPRTGATDPRSVVGAAPAPSARPLATPSRPARATAAALSQALRSQPAPAPVAAGSEEIALSSQVISSQASQAAPAQVTADPAELHSQSFAVASESVDAAASEPEIEVAGEPVKSFSVPSDALEPPPEETIAAGEVMQSAGAAVIVEGGPADSPEELMDVQSSEIRLADLQPPAAAPASPVEQESLVEPRQSPSSRTRAVAALRGTAHLLQTELGKLRQRAVALPVGELLSREAGRIAQRVRSQFGGASRSLGRTPPPAKLALAAGIATVGVLCLWLVATSDAPAPTHALAAVEVTGSLHRTTTAAAAAAPRSKERATEKAPARTPEAADPAGIAGERSGADRAADELEDELDEPPVPERSGPRAARLATIASARKSVEEGHRLMRRRRLGMAEASYLKAVRRFPAYPRAMAGLVRVHLARKDGKEALRWAKKLVALQPNRGYNQLLLGDALALRGRKAAARGAWRKALRYGDARARKRLR